MRVHYPKCAYGLSRNCNSVGLLHHSFWLSLVLEHHFKLFELLCLAKDHWCGFRTQNAHMVTIVNWIWFKEVLWSIRGSYSAIWSIPLPNVKWHSDPWPTVTSQPIRLSTNFMTFIPSLNFTDYEWFPWSICNGCGMPAGNAYPSGHLVPSPIVGLACAPIVETRFLELAMSLLDFSPRMPLGTFWFLLKMV